MSRAIRLEPKGQKGRTMSSLPSYLIDAALTLLLVVGVILTMRAY